MYTDFLSMVATNEDLGFEYLLFLEKWTWEEARGGCVDRGYGLAKIESAEEHDFINGLLQRNECKNIFESCHVNMVMLSLSGHNGVIDFRK